MKKVYSVFMHNGMRWVKHSVANEYFDEESAIKEKQHIYKIWSQGEGFWHSVRFWEVEDDYVLPEKKALPKPPERTLWGTRVQQFN